MKTIVTIKPLANYRLECVFDDGSKKIADITPFLQKEAFRPLSEPNIFSSALQNHGYFVEWKNYEIDLSADTLWHIAMVEPGN